MPRHTLDITFTILFDKLDGEELMGTIIQVMDCLSELYACCSIIKEKYDEIYKSAVIKTL